MYESKLLAELERRFPWLVDPSAEATTEDVVNAVVDWHAEVKAQAVADLLAVAWRDRDNYQQSLGNIEELLGVDLSSDETDWMDMPAEKLVEHAREIRRAQRGAVSLPLAAAQAAIALGLASGVASLMAWAQGLIGGAL